MKKTSSSLIALLFLVGCLNAQSIDFTELSPGPAFPDARNGTIAKGDIDDDGDIDVFIAGKDGTQLQSRLYSNDGTGNFTEIAGTPFVGMQFGDSEFADVDQDGDLDLLMTGSNLQSSYFADLYMNDGTGVFTLVPNTPFELSTEGDIAFADIDNDTDLDVMIVGYDLQGDGFAKLYQNDGFGVFTELSTSNFEPAKSGSIAFFDFDNDNDEDVLIAGENNNGLILTTLYSNNGSGVYSLVSNTAFVGVTSGDLAIADTDNDGDLDVLLSGSNGGSNSTNVYLNDGLGGFSLLANTSFPQTSFGDAEFADFDNDGDMDVLITGLITGSEFTADIFENTGSNTFIFSDTLNPMYLTSTAIADIDGDTDLDVIIVGILNNTSPFKTRTFINNTTALSVRETELNSRISVYPNPSTNAINIDANGEQLNEIEVLNLIGEPIMKTNVLSKHYSLDLSGFSNGTYFVRIVFENREIEIIKVVKGN